MKDTIQTTGGVLHPKDIEFINCGDDTLVCIAFYQ